MFASCEEGAEYKLSDNSAEPGSSGVYILYGWVLIVQQRVHSSTSNVRYRLNAKQVSVNVNITDDVSYSRSGTDQSGGQDEEVLEGKVVVKILHFLMHIILH